MKQTFMYLVFIIITIFCVMGSFTMNIPIDNQIALFFFGLISLSLLVTMGIHDMRSYIKKKKDLHL